MADYGLWSGLERATGNMATTGMGLLKMQQDRMAQEEKMGIEREQLQTQKALANIQIEEANKRKAAYDRPVDVTVHPMFLSMPESVRPEVLKYLTSNGYVNESGIGKAGDLEKAAGAIESTAPLFNKFMRPVIDQKKQIVMGAWNELQQARSDGDQKKIAAALSKFNIANADYQDSNGKFLEHIKGLTEQEQKLAVEQAKKTGTAAPKVVGNYLVDEKGNVIFKGTQDKQVERTVDLGDRVEYIYADGKREVKPKGVSPTQPMGQMDRTLISKTLTEIPKLKADAITQGNNIERINRALSLVETGVTGKGGQVKAFLAPYAEMIGVPSQNMDDSQLFQMLTRVIVGPMRLDIIGPGPVSEWEQKLMQQISGGGGAAKTAARELLGYYKKQAAAKVDNYNATLEGLSSIYPRVSEIHKPVGKKSAGPQPGTAGTPKKVGRFTVEVE